MRWGRGLPRVGVQWAALNADPYPTWRRLRRKGPVGVLPRIGDLWFVTRWDDVRAVLVDDETYRSKLDPLRPALECALPFTDGDQHDRIRSVVQPHLNPRAIRGFVETTVDQLAADLLDRLTEEPAGDLLSRYAEPLALLSVRKLLSIEDLPLRDLREWRVRVGMDYAFAAHGDRAQGPRDRDVEATTKLRAAAAAEPDGSLLSSLVHGNDDGPVLSEAEQVATLNTLAFVAVDGLRDAISQTLHGLLTYPTELELVREDPELYRPALEEAVRWSCPVHTVFRQPVSDTELAGVSIPAGKTVAVGVGSANRDEKRWSDPDRFDLRRDEGMHLGFATGDHYCLGAWLAREAGPLAARRAVERLPGLRATPDRPPVVSGWMFRRVQELFAAWD